MRRYRQRHHKTREPHIEGNESRVGEEVPNLHTPTSPRPSRIRAGLSLSDAGEVLCFLDSSSHRHRHRPKDYLCRLSMLSRRKQSKDRTSVNGDAISASDELSRKLEGWSRLKESLYGSSPPTATVRVTVLAATGLMSADPYWVGCCAGSHASTGPSSHFEAGIESAPRGSPSWSSDPIILDIHDLTSDVLLLLCEPSVRDGSHHCVGRIVLPLCDFLPALNPCDGILGGITSPPAHQLWSAIVSPGPECAPKSVAPLLAAAIPGIPGAGLPSPAAAMQQSSTSAEAYDETPPVHGAALVRVEITLHSPLAASLLWSPPFDPSIVPLIDAASGQAVILPQRALIAVHRLSTALTGVPALLQLLALA